MNLSPPKTKIENFASLMTGLQCCVVILATLAGGVWTSFLFRDLRQKTKADKELIAMETQREFAELQSLEIKRRIESKYDVNVNLAVSQLNHPKEGKSNSPRVISIDISFTNLGNEVEKLSLSRELFCYIGKVTSVDEDGAMSLSNKRKFQFLDASQDIFGGASVMPGKTTSKIAAIQHVDEPGLYAVIFSTKSVLPPRDKSVQPPDKSVQPPDKPVLPPERYVPPDKSDDIYFASKFILVD